MDFDPRAKEWADTYFAAGVGLIVAAVLILVFEHRHGRDDDDDDGGVMVVLPAPPAPARPAGEQLPIQAVIAP